MINNRQQQQGRRRGRGRNPQGNGGRNEGGSRIDNRARGNAPQMLEKYKNMARDAQMQGDRVMTEYYLQFADHYFRIVAESRARFEEQRRQRDDWQEDGDEGDGEDRMAADTFGSELDSDEDAQERQPRQQQSDNRRREGGRDAGGRDANREGRNDNRRDRNTRRPAHGAVDREEDDMPSTLDVSVLPPAFASDGPMMPIDLDEAPEESPAPRRRGRPRRVEVIDIEGEAAEV